MHGFDRWIWGMGANLSLSFRTNTIGACQWCTIWWGWYFMNAIRWFRPYSCQGGYKELRYSAYKFFSRRPVSWRERAHADLFLWVSHACRWRAYRANGTQPTCMKRFHILILSHRPATDTLDPINHFQAADAGRTKVNKTETKRNKKRKKWEKNSFSQGILDDQRLVFVCYLRE